MRIYDEFDYVYNEYSKSLFNIAYGYLKNKDDCADIVQKVFLKTLANNNNFTSYDDIKYYLIRITINCCLDLLKSSYKKKTILNDEIVIKTKSSQNDDSSNYEIVACIDKIPYKYKTVIILYYYNLMSIKDISFTLKISVDATKKRLERAKKMIKTLMERN